MLETITGKYTIKQILADNWEKFCRDHADYIRPAVKENVERILACGDKEGCSGIPSLRMSKVRKTAYRGAHLQIKILQFLRQSDDRQLDTKRPKTID